MMKKNEIKKEVQAGKMLVKGKFIYCGEEKFYIKGVTYGTFKRNINGDHFPCPELMEKDFEMMSLKGINSVRTYTVPPVYVLDMAEKYGLKVMVGLPWEQHITFLDNAERKKDIIKRVTVSVLQCEKHSAILCYTIGNEIPAPIVRWYGKKRIEHFLKQLYKTVKQIDEDALVTYVNYPTTEYLDLGFLDFDCFNVYLETPEKLSSYLSRLHNLSGDRPLLLAEIGLDSYRNGVQKQAEILGWQIKTIFEKGCAGMFVFAWTDEWWRGGFDIEDWDFGLVDRQRNAKPALEVVSTLMGNIPFFTKKPNPSVTVIVCTYNGSATIKECIEGILKLDYPNFDVIVVNDGSKDNTAEIVQQYPVKLINTSNRGLSSARNTGMNNSGSEIIAYIDDDAWPDPQWLNYLTYAHTHSEHACIGGPNIAPYDEGFISTCVANAPGGPVHVLLTDEIAEHVPGCNMSFRRETLLKIGGFDPVFRTAGDDVDVCWRIQESGNTISFHPSAVVWHRRRNSFKAYWKQQKGYGNAEALLESKWPEKYNSLGHLSWAGRIYGNGCTIPVRVKKDKIFHGTWGTALFQSVYEPAGSFINSIPLMPEWYLFSAALCLLGCLGFLWSPFLWFFSAFALSIAIVFIQAVISAEKNSSLQAAQKKKIKYRSLIVLLHMIQPVARLYGRFANGLTPWRKRGAGLHTKFLFTFGVREFTYWSETWKSTEDWLLLIEQNLLTLQKNVKKGGVFDNWDIQIKTGLFAKSRCLLTVEEHGAGKQFVRIKCRPVFSLIALLLPIIFLILGGLAAFQQQWIVCGVTGLTGLLLIFNIFISSASTINNFYKAFMHLSVIGKTANDLKPGMHLTAVQGKIAVVNVNSTVLKTGKKLSGLLPAVE